MLKSTPEVNQADSHGVGEVNLRTLFDREEPKLLRYAFSLTGRRAVAEEIVQEVFLQLHAKWGEVESPRAWLFRSIRNRAFHYLRKSKREILQGDGNVEPAAERQEEPPDVAMERMETEAALRSRLEELEEGDRQLVKLKYFEGLKYREISERTGLSVSNVGFRLHRILKQFARALGSLDIDKEL